MGDPRLAIALDVDNLGLACEVADVVRPYMGVAKVGLELFTAAGATAITAMQQRNLEVFLDIKLHDIPTTVGRAAAQAGRSGVRWLTIHTAGGAEMLKAGVDGLASASDTNAQVLGVTILTSDKDRSRELLAHRVGLARDAGCGGIICGASDITVAKEVAPRLTLVVPGIRLDDSAHHDQATAVTPQAAIAVGADILVIGRTLTAGVSGLAVGSSQLRNTLATVAERAARIATDIG